MLFNSVRLVGLSQYVGLICCERTSFKLKGSGPTLDPRPVTPGPKAPEVLPSDNKILTDLAP
ncbi:hypothetical protein L484_002919 [Morus notabilis]|uniref:Uncharacterized protein n=1 Tax=Morus notabilis TaxID=981085 RepID=W9RD62_9ROSA|nr:hypothetical protein L484_002919 [Morus notabilis]